MRDGSGGKIGGRRDWGMVKRVGNAGQDSPEVSTSGPKNAGPVMFAFTLRRISAADLERRDQ